MFNATKPLALLSVLVLSSCNQVLGIEDTSLDPQQGARTGPWRCVTGKPPIKPADMPAKIKLFMRATNLENNLEVGQAGVNFKVCNNRNSPSCDQPGDDKTTGEDGNVTLEADTFGVGFNGFIKITDARQIEPGKEATQFITFHYFFSNTLYADTKIPNSIMISLGGLDFLVGTLAKIPFPDGQTSAGLRHISATPLDCDGNLAPGVSFQVSGAGGELGPNAVPWYFNNAVPSPQASATDGTGPGGYFFLDTGIYRVDAKTQTDGTVSSAASIVLSEGAFSTVLMLPQLPWSHFPPFPTGSAPSGSCTNFLLKGGLITSQFRSRSGRLLTSIVFSVVSWFWLPGIPC